MGASSSRPRKPTKASSVPPDVVELPRPPPSPQPQQQQPPEDNDSIISEFGELNLSDYAIIDVDELPPGTTVRPPPGILAHLFQPPENELQKIGTGERVMSEHQLRVQRSLQKLNIPDWYKTSVAGRPEGFRLKKEAPPAQGWPGLGSKTTSLSSLGSSQSAAARSPTGCHHLLSPSPTPSPHVFTRWSTSRLNSSTATSTSTSPCGSTRSSFNYRQPYLGWRSQERLTRPRTPAERLAAGIPPQQISPTKQQVPNLSEVRTSIKEVTSAIVHYVSGVRDSSGGDISHNEESPANRSPHWEGESLSPRGEWGSVSRSSSPRGSGRLCWLESSFVGSRPLDSPETPITLPSTHVNKTLKALDNDIDGPERISSGGDLYLDFNNTKPQHQHHNTHVNGEYLLT